MLRQVGASTPDADVAALAAAYAVQSKQGVLDARALLSDIRSSRLRHQPPQQ